MVDDVVVMATWHKFGPQESCEFDLFCVGVAV